MTLLKLRAYLTKLGRAATRQNAPQAAPAPARDVTPQPEPGRRWYTLPGGRIELSDTGFAITLEAAEAHPFRVITPEGQAVASGSPGFLAQLKEYAERLAAERDEFVYRSEER